MEQAMPRIFFNLAAAGADETAGEGLAALELVSPRRRKRGLHPHRRWSGQCSRRGPLQPWRWHLRDAISAVFIDAAGGGLVASE